jgi:FAD/FMN-containing dehydrogenase
MPAWPGGPAPRAPLPFSLNAVHPHDPGGGYVNFMSDDEGQDRIKAFCGENYDRLVAVKRKYDPGNLFRVNQNINPAG